MSLNKPTTSYKLFTKARKSSMNSTIVKRVTKVAPIGPLGQGELHERVGEPLQAASAGTDVGRVHRGAI